MNLDKGNIYVCGDIHGERNISKLSTRFWPEQKTLDKDDVLIILGDFGLLFEKWWDKQEINWFKWLANKKCTVAFVDGNHENFTRLKMYPIVKKWGGYVRVISYGDCVIYWLLRGEIYTINGRKILTIGGADSTDIEPHKYSQAERHMYGYYGKPWKGRTALYDWWEDEQITIHDINNAINNLSKHNNTVDYILTHTIPYNDAIFLNTVCSMGLEVLKGNHISMERLETIKEIATFKEWHCGHLHLDVHIENIYTHYNYEPDLLV